MVTGCLEESDLVIEISNELGGILKDITQVAGSLSIESSLDSGSEAQFLKQVVRRIKSLKEKVDKHVC